MGSNVKDKYEFSLRFGCKDGEEEEEEEEGGGGGGGEGGGEEEEEEATPREWSVHTC